MLSEWQEPLRSRSTTESGNERASESRPPALPVPANSTGLQLANAPALAVLAVAGCSRVRPAGAAHCGGLLDKAVFRITLVS